MKRLCSIAVAALAACSSPHATLRPDAAPARAAARTVSMPAESARDVLRAETSSMEDASTPPPGAGVVGFRLPVLLFHDFGDGPKDLWVKARVFDAMLEALGRTGAPSLSMPEVYVAVRKHESLPRGGYAITFDDGAETQFTVAFPILERHRVKATLYVVPDRVGKPGYLTWPQLQRMVATGLITIGAHTMDHVVLPSLPAGVAFRQIAESRLVLQQRLHVPVSEFAYPFGDFSPAVEALVRRAGLEDAVTTQPDLVLNPRDPWSWGRLRLTNADSPAVVAHLAAIGGAWRRDRYRRRTESVAQRRLRHKETAG